MRHSCRFLLALLPFSFVFVMQLFAQDTNDDFQSEPREKSESTSLLTRAEGIREHLDDKGMALGLAFVNDWSKNFRGGSSSAGSFDRYSLDLTFTLNTDKAFGWNGGTTTIHFKNHFGESGGDHVGDAQGFSNIDDVSRTHLYELWYEQKLAGDRVRAKFGKIDANSEFAVVKTAVDFLNSSMGYSPTILALPTYPEPKPAFNVFVSPLSHYQVSAGLFRTAGSGNMLLFEGARDWRIGSRELTGRSSLGMWRLSGPIACFDGDALKSTQGFYAVTEQALWKDKSSGQKEIDAFLQLGLANGDVSRFTRHIGGGVVFQAPFASRPHDSLGIAATSARFTDEPDAGYQYEAELALETYYKVGFGRFVSLAPDVQFIHHPGGLFLQKDALVLTPRLTLSF
jgi:carbohydrate-selective porin OprB